METIDVCVACLDHNRKQYGDDLINDRCASCREDAEENK